MYLVCPGGGGGGLRNLHQMFPPVDAKVKQITEILLASESLQTF